MKIAATGPRTWPSRLASYIKPRPETTGDLNEPSTLSALLGGGLPGYISGGPVGASGGLGGYFGVKAGQAYNSLPIAIATGALTGAASSTIMRLGLLALQHPQLVSLSPAALAITGAASVGGAIVWATREVSTEDREAVKRGRRALGGLLQGSGAELAAAAGSVDPSGLFTGALRVAAEDDQTLVRGGRALGGLLLGAGAGLAASGLSQIAHSVEPSALLHPALVGGFIGTVATLSGDRRATIRDGVYGGMVAGGIAAVLTGNPLQIAAGATGAGIAGRAIKPAGRLVLATLAGAAAGSLAAAPAGAEAMLTGAVSGALSASAGTVVGPLVRQVMRNLTVDASIAAIAKIDPYLKAHPLGHGQKILLGASLGAISLGPLGRVFGWTGAGIAAGLGAVAGAIQTEKILRQRAADETEFLTATAAIATGHPLDLPTLTPASRKGPQVQ